MKREDLKKLELTDEAIDKIMALHGQDIEAHKTNLTALTAERETLKTQLDDASKQINEFKGMDIEGVKKAAADWEAKVKQTEAEYSQKLLTLEFNNDYSKALTAAKVKYENEVKARLKADELKDSTGKFIPERFNEQVAKLKAESADLFHSDTPTPAFSSGGGKPETATMFTKEQLRTMSPQEINKNWDAISASLKQGK